MSRRSGGSFRWTGTRTLVFTPDPTVALPYSTRYTVTVDRSATAVSGRRLERPYTFSFTTPTVRLLATNWYRRGDRFDAPIVVSFRFNQPVRPRDVADHVRLRYRPHGWTPPAFSAAARLRLAAVDPAGLKAFEAKVAATDAAARSSAALTARVIDARDIQRRGAPAPTLVVGETATVPPPESGIGVEVPAGMRGVEGSVNSPRPQTYTMELEPAFFVYGPACTSGCAPDRVNAMVLRRDARTADVRRAFSALDVTAGRDRPVSPTLPEPPRRYTDRGDRFTLEDLGYERQRPVTTYLYRLDPSPRALDGQPLGYPWIEVVENWHERAFTSSGDGHGVMAAGARRPSRRGAGSRGRTAEARFVVK